MAALLAAPVAAQIPSAVPDLWSSYLGGGGNDAARTIAVAGDGSLVVGGWAGSSGFPTTPGAYDEIGGGDAFVARFSADGRELLWSTCLGGSGVEEISDLVVAADGSIVVCGWTSSRDFPTTPGAFQPHFGGAGLVAGLGDAFVARLSSDGRRLLWSTYLGGAGDDFGRAIRISPSGEITVAGETDSEYFPTTLGVLQETFGSINLLVPDIFVTRMRLEDGALLWSTYYGGGRHETLGGIDIDADGRVLIGGLTASEDLPQPAGESAALIRGTVDSYLAVISADGARVEVALQFGGLGSEEVRDVAFDAQGDLWAVGLTADEDDSTPGMLEVGVAAWQPRPVGDAEGFVLRFSADGSELSASTLIGGTGDDRCEAIALLPDGDLLVAGATEGGDFPLTGQAELPVYAGGTTDIFVARFDRELLQASAIGLFGGSDKDLVEDLVAIGDSGFAAAGSSFSMNLPGTLGAAQPLSAGGSEAMLLRGDREPAGDAELLLGAGEIGLAESFESGATLPGLAPVLHNRSATPAVFDSVEVLLGGDFDPLRDLVGLRLLLDLDGDGEADPGEPQLGGLVTVDAIGGRARFEFEPQTVDAGSTLGLLVMIDSQGGCRDGVEFVVGMLPEGAIDPRDGRYGRRLTSSASGLLQGRTWFCGARHLYSGDSDLDGVATCRDLRRLAARLGGVASDADFDPDRDGSITDADLELAMDRVLGRVPAWVPDLEARSGGPLVVFGYDLPGDLGARIGVQPLEVWIRAENSAVFAIPDSLGFGQVELVLVDSEGRELGRHHIELL